MWSKYLELGLALIFDIFSRFQKANLKPLDTFFFSLGVVLFSKVTVSNWLGNNNILLNIQKNQNKNYQFVWAHYSRIVVFLSEEELE